jgi:hypothetical protein
MDILRAAFVPGLIAGIISVFTSWLWMGVIFHRYQRATPEIWRAEGPRNYALSSIVRVLSAIAIAVLYVFVVRFHIAWFSDGTVGAFRFAAAIWMAVAAPVAIESAIYIRMHSMVVLGQVIDWLTTSILTCVITGWWIAE